MKNKEPPQLDAKQTAPQIEIELAQVVEAVETCSTLSPRIKASFVTIVMPNGAVGFFDEKKSRLSARRVAQARQASRRDSRATAHKWQKLSEPFTIRSFFS